MLLKVAHEWHVLPHVLESLPCHEYDEMVAALQIIYPPAKK